MSDSWCAWCGDPLGPRQTGFCKQECADDFAADYWQSRQRASASCCGAEGAAIPPHTRPPETRLAGSPGLASPFARHRPGELLWTEEETEVLRRILADSADGVSVSASQAARTLSEELHRPVTKNMVIGRCWRAGIELPKARQRWHPAEPTPNHFPDARGCLWPVGHPNDPQFHFCGQKRRAPNQPYCPVHAASARAEKPNPPIPKSWGKVA